MASGSQKRELRTGLFLSVSVAVAVAVFFAPFGNWRDAKIVSMAWTTAPPVVIGGNSVLKHISACDSDQRHIADFMSADLGVGVTDLSYGGQTLIEQVAYLGAALRNPHVRVVIAAAALSDFMPGPLPSLRRRLLFGLTSPVAGLVSPAGAGSVTEAIMGRDLPVNFDYAGEHFPSYEYIKQKYFLVEQTNERCPEADGTNMRFVAAIYYGVLVAPELDPGAVTLVAALSRAATAHGKEFMVVIQPLDSQLVARLDPGWIDPIERKRQKLIQSLQAAGVHALDLTEKIPNGMFADRWCACGHLQQEGRSETARWIVHSIGDTSLKH